MGADVASPSPGRSPRGALTVATTPTTSFGASAASGFSRLEQSRRPSASNWLREMNKPRDRGERASFETAASDDDAWSRICRRLRAELGDDIYSSWFGRLELDGIAGPNAYLSVPTKFLKSWIQAHYLDKILALMGPEFPEVRRLALNLRSAPRLPLPRAELDGQRRTTPAHAATVASARSSRSTRRPKRRATGPATTSSPARRSIAA
jgi:hypothetical protein